MYSIRVYAQDMNTQSLISKASLVGLCALLAASTLHARDKRDGIQVQVDRRVELFSILWRLAEVREYTLAPAGPYLAAVEAHFRKHADHPAVAAVRKLHGEHSISYNAPMALAVHLDPKTLAPLVPLTPFPARLDSRWRNAPTADFLKQVRAFNKDTGFDAFFAKQSTYLGKVEDRYRKALKDCDPLAWCQDFFGPKRKVRVVVTPGLLCGPNGYGTSVLLSDGTEDLRPILGVSHLYSEGLPAFDDSPDLAAYLQHEIAHAYANSAVDKNAKALEPVGKRLWQRVAGAMKKQAYSNWKVMLYETLVRASTVLFLLDRFGETAAAAAQARHKGRSFLWIKEVVQALDEYRKQDRPPRDLCAFLPKLVPILKRWASKQDTKRLGTFPGPINAVFSPSYRTSSRMLLVGQIPEQGKAGKALTDYVAWVHKRFYEEHGVPLKQGADLSAAEIRTKGLVLYGTPAGSLVLKKILDRLGWRVGPKSIGLGPRIFKGQDLVLVACHPHPDDPEQPVLIYTAAHAELLPQINNLFHGPTDWVVARRTGPGRYEEVAKGFFPKGLDGSWRPLGP